MKLLSLLFPFAASAASAAPTPPTPPTPSAPAAPTVGNWTYKSGSSEIDIQTTGEVTLDPTSAEVFSIRDDGTLRVQEKTGKDLKLLSAKKGSTVWLVNGKSKPFGADGKTWLRELLKARPATPTPPTPPK